MEAAAYVMWFQAKTTRRRWCSYAKADACRSRLAVQSNVHRSCTTSCCTAGNMCPKKDRRSSISIMFSTTLERPPKDSTRKRRRRTAMNRREDYECAGYDCSRGRRTILGFDLWEYNLWVRSVIRFVVVLYRHSGTIWEYNTGYNIHFATMRVSSQHSNYGEEIAPPPNIATIPFLQPSAPA